MQTNKDVVVFILCFHLLQSLSRSQWPSPACGRQDELTQIDNHIHNASVGRKPKDTVAPF